MSVTRSFLFLGVLVVSAASLFGQAFPSAKSEVPVFPASENRVFASNALSADAEPVVAPEPSAAPALIATPVKPATKTVVDDSGYARNKKIWYSLIAANHTAAFVDAWSTRRAVQRGAQELNPLMKPFANSNAMYPATQIVPVGMDYLGRRMLRSDNAFLRKIWWLPQTASTVASLAAGIHNLSVK